MTPTPEERAAKACGVPFVDIEQSVAEAIRAVEEEGTRDMQVLIREAREIKAERDRLRAVLAELVACADTDPCPNMRANAAWDSARAALSK